MIGLFVLITILSTAFNSESEDWTWTEVEKHCVSKETNSWTLLRNTCKKEFSVLLSFALKSDLKGERENENFENIWRYVSHFASAFEEYNEQVIEQIY